MLLIGIVCLKKDSVRDILLKQIGMKTIQEKWNLLKQSKSFMNAEKNVSIY